MGGIFLAYKRSNSIGITTVAAAMINLLVDILYGLIDPRIKAQYVKGNKNGKRKNK